MPKGKQYAMNFRTVQSGTNERDFQQTQQALERKPQNRIETDVDSTINIQFILL